LPLRNAQIPHNPYATPHHPDECHDKRYSQHACFGTADNRQGHAVKGTVHNGKTSWLVCMRQDSMASPCTGFGTTAPQHVRMVADALDEDKGKWLGGCIVLPQNANHRCQVLVDKNSPLDIAQLGNPRYHGRTKGYNPLTMAIVHHCGYTKINNSDDVILSYNAIIHLHSLVLETWEHSWGYSRGPQIDQILKRSAGIPSLDHVGCQGYSGIL
jgi:hypothetical protein